MILQKEIQRLRPTDHALRAVIWSQPGRVWSLNHDDRSERQEGLGLSDCLWGSLFLSISGSHMKVWDEQTSLCLKWELEMRSDSCPGSAQGLAFWQKSILNKAPYKPVSRLTHWWPRLASPADLGSPRGSWLGRTVRFSYLHPVTCSCVKTS